MQDVSLTHWGQNKMATILQTTSSKLISVNVNEICSILILISLKFVPEDLINNKSALIQIMAWWQTGNKPLPEPMQA